MFETLELKSGRERSINHKHPWIFSGAIKKLPNISTGTIVKVVDNKGQCLAYGFFDKQSQIVCKLFYFTEEHLSLDFFGFDFWFQKFKVAFEMRKDLVLTESTNCCRLIHAEGDGLPGLIADAYDDTVVLQVLHKGTENILDHITQSIYKLGFKYIYIKSKESTKNIENLALKSGWIADSRSQPIEVKEHDCLFNVNVEDGQKTGFFIDQRENRKLVETLAKDKTVLNAFSYTGGFSVYAAKGLAQKVYSIDISASAIEASKQNMQLNHADHIHEALAVDCFDYLKNLEQDFFDMIILDPPAFAKSARMVQNAARGYKEINLMALYN
ncbi:MAG: class I SAM-dependent rRNA methyltransferase [Bacteroidetes bacterium]|nr:class I SAM-dependent rRNA methyltransferase [Bacteroidota bacterium]